MKQERHDGGRRGGERHRDEDGHADDEAQMRDRRKLIGRDEEDQEPEADAEHQADGGLLRHDADPGLRIDLPGRQSSDHDDHALGADVPGGPVDDGDEGGQSNHSAQLGRELRDKNSGNHAAHPADQKPGEPDPGQSQGREGSNLLGVVGTGHLEDVFGGFFPQDVDHVVHRDDPDEHVVFVDHRNGQNVVTGDQPGDVFLVSVDVHALGADVPGGPVDDGDEGGQSNHSAQLGRELRDKNSGNHAAHPADQKPGEPDPGQSQGREGSNLLGVVGTGHLEDVFGGFFPQDVDHVVHRDDPDEHVVFVDHRNGQNVVTGDQPGDVFLVSVDVHAPDVGSHGFGEILSLIRQEKLPEADDASHLMVFIDHVDIKNIFDLARLANLGDRLFDGQVLVQGDV